MIAASPAGENMARSSLIAVANDFGIFLPLVSSIVMDPKTNAPPPASCTSPDSSAESAGLSVPKKTARILIADDHEAVRRGLRSALSAAGWDVCADAINGKEAVEKAAELKPDLIILDSACRSWAV